jgi:hypothetical protein
MFLRNTLHAPSATICYHQSGHFSVHNIASLQREGRLDVYVLPQLVFEQGLGLLDRQQLSQKFAEQSMQLLARTLHFAAP